MRLAEPLNAVKYGAWHAMKFDEMQKRMDAIEERIRRLEVDGKKMTFSSDGIMYGEGIMIGTENMQRENEARTVEMMEGKIKMSDSDGMMMGAENMQSVETRESSEND